MLRQGLRVKSLDRIAVGNPCDSFIAGVLAVCRTAIAAAFIVAGLSHLQNILLFYVSIARYQLPFVHIQHFLGLTMPWGLILTGLFLLHRQTRTVGFVLATFFSFLFAVVKTIAFARGLEIDCGCFGMVAHELIDLRHILLSWSFFGGVVLIAIASRRSFRFESLRRQTPDILQPRSES